MNPRRRNKLLANARRTDLKPRRRKHWRRMALKQHPMLKLKSYPYLDAVVPHVRQVGKQYIKPSDIGAYIARRLREMSYARRNT